MTKKKLLKNLSWLCVEKICRIFGALVVGVWVARYLGPDDFGVLSYALAYTAFFILFVNLGFDQIVVREIVKKPKLTNNILGTTFGLKFIGALIAIGLIAVSLIYFQTDALTKSVIFVVAIGLIFQSFDVIDFFYQSKILSKYVVIARNSAFVLSSLLKVYFIVHEYSVIYFAISNVVDVFLAAVFLMITYKKTGYEISKWRFSKKIAIRLLKFSWPLAICTFLISVHMKIDQVMIRNILNSEQLGIYSVAVRLSEFWYFIPTIIVSTLMPYFVNLRESNKELYNFRLMQLYSIMFWMGVSVGLFVMVFGGYIIRFLYGDVYNSAYRPLMFNIWAGVFVAQALARSIWIISENLQLYVIMANIVAVIINIILNLILIHRLGISGAAIATLLTRFINNLITPIVIKPYRDSIILSTKCINPYYVYKRRPVSW